MSSAYKPEWSGSIEGYVVNFVSKNLWRVAPTHDRDDAMQEAYVCFLRCASRYPMLDAPQHFMALFKTTWANEFNDLSVKATKARKSVPLSQLSRVDENGDEVEYSREGAGCTDNDGALAVMIAQAPKEVLMVMNLFLNAPAELLEVAQAAWKSSGKNSPGGERWVEKVLGLKLGTDPIKKTQDYFTGQ